MALHGVFGEGRIAGPLIDWGVFAAFSVFGGVLVTGGLVVLLLRRQLLVPLYLLVYSAAMCLTPFPDQYLRYPHAGHAARGADGHRVPDGHAIAARRQA